MSESDSPSTARRIGLGLGYALLAVLLGLIGLAWQQDRALSAWQAKARASLDARAAAARQRLNAVRAVAAAPSAVLVGAGLGVRSPTDPSVVDALRQRWRASGASAVWLVDFTGEPILVEPQTLPLAAGAAVPAALHAGLRGRVGCTPVGSGGTPALRLYVPLYAGAAGRSQVAALLLFDLAFADWFGRPDEDAAATLLLAPDGRVVASELPHLLGQRLPPDANRLHLDGVGFFARADARLELEDADGSLDLVQLRRGVLSLTPWLHWGGTAAALLVLALSLAHLVGRQRRGLERRVSKARVAPWPTHLPYIEGLDLDVGLLAAEGDEARYLDRLRAFLLEEGARMRRIHAHLAAGRQDVAEAEVTQAHAAAREVGAGVLQSRIDMLHASLRRRDPTSRIEPRLRDAAAELDKTLRAIWAGLDKIAYLPTGMLAPPASIRDADLALPQAEPAVAVKALDFDAVFEIHEVDPALPQAEPAVAVKALDFDAAFGPNSAPARTAPSPLEGLLERIERNDPGTLAYLKANQVALARTLTPRAVVELNRRLVAGDWSGAAALCRESL